MKQKWKTIQEIELNWDWNRNSETKFELSKNRICWTGTSLSPKSTRLSERNKKLIERIKERKQNSRKEVQKNSCINKIKYINYYYYI